MKTNIQVLAIPATHWKMEPLASIVYDAEVAERRLLKGSNVDVERQRYTLFCAQMERWAAQIAGSGVPATTLGDDYLGALEQLTGLAPNLTPAAAATARLAASFVPPEKLAEHTAMFAALAERARVDDNPAIRTRLSFLHGLAAGGFGIIERQSAFQVGAAAIVPGLACQEGQVEPAPIAASATASGLAEEIHRGLLYGEAVNFSNAPHPAITEALHHLAYDQPPAGRETIDVVYSDGSQAEPLPVGVLQLPSPEDLLVFSEQTPLRVSLLSMRHLEMDAIVDMAWFLNQEASRPRSLAETEAFCCRRTLAQLDAMKRPACLYLYQTGLQPAVVGFCRALVAWLRSHRNGPPELLVVPQYYHEGNGNDENGGYRAGSAWC